MFTFYLSLISFFAAFSASPQQSSAITEKVHVYDYFELSVPNKSRENINPFIDITFTMQVTDPAGKTTNINGFCDAGDGSVFRARFMPSKAGIHTYNAVLKIDGTSKKFSGKFEAVASGKNGPVRVDPDHPWHFIYEGTGRHFFWNSTTCYFLMGWKDEKTIENIIDRYARYDINRIRVGINGRTVGAMRWYEPNVVECSDFTYMLNAWPAERPMDVNDPGYDVSRFNVSHWQKLDRLVAYANRKNIQVSLIFYVDGLDYGCDPFKREKMGKEDEQRYYAYAAARYSAFPNIMWDVTNEYHLFRSVEWVKQMAPFLKVRDENKHLLSVHGSGDFPFRKEPWVDLALYQSWDECGGYNFMTGNRKLQESSGRVMPQVNEEYGYEDHYPPWGCGPTTNNEPDFRKGIYRSQLAWEICMAGGYQTTGEKAGDGTGAGSNSGGGWINGRGNENMTMLKYYAIMKNVFESVEYWNLEPHNELVPYGDLCLANPGREYLAYIRTHHGRVTLNQGEKYSVTMINPQTGEKKILPDLTVENSGWHYPKELTEYWAVILKRIE
jgi:hypothetical protein